jgi:hypothetical protein
MQIKALISYGKAQIEIAGYSSVDAEILFAPLRLDSHGVA